MVGEGIVEGNRVVRLVFGGRKEVRRLACRVFIAEVRVKMRHLNYFGVLACGSRKQEAAVNCYFCNVYE